MADECAQPTTSVGNYAVDDTEPSFFQGFGFLKETRVGRAFGKAALSKLGAALIVAVIATVSTSEDAAAKRKYASIVIDAGTGEILHQEYAAEKRYPASLTKMMTLYMLFEALDRKRFRMDSRLKVSSKAAQQPASHLKLKAGRSITVENAIYALITKSANDVAVVVAEAIGRSEQGFARLMTRKARALGMTETVFRNASGLPDSKQVTTARDMAQLSRAMLYHFPHYYHYFSTERFTYKGKTYRNHNRLLETYEGADGLKTGYIKASGFNLATSAVRHGRRLITVVFGGKTSASRNRRVAELLDLGFKEIKQAPPMAIAEATSPPPVPNSKPVIARRVEEVGVGSRGDALTRGSGAKVANVGWGVQVGAYSRFGTAHLAVSQAARHAPHLLNQTSVAIVPLERGQATLYRARMVGLTQQAATQACEILRKKKLQCLTVPPGENARTALSTRQ
ncbi:MAG: D-alanyl-D-alanine carboxypeptidase family protein [Pseudomonadota bacterium]